MAICRFCKKDFVQVLFYPTKSANTRQSGEFTCTNCGFGRHGTILKCHQCGIIYVDESISQKKINSYYEITRDSLYFSEQKAREVTFRNYLARLEKVFPRKGKLLDIGTNTGLFVKLAANSGWEAIGLEPNKSAVKYGQEKYKIKIVTKPFGKNSFPKASFDVITMWDVIEHFTDPVSEMKNVLYCLKPGGVFAFSTVDPESWLAKVMGTNWPWYMEMHRVFFTPITARAYLTAVGFGRIIIKPHFRNLSLSYLSSRLVAINQLFSRFFSYLVKLLKMDKVIVPYYANDLFDCYAFKT